MGMDPDADKQSDEDEETIDAVIAVRRRRHKRAFEHSRNLVIPQPERTIVKAERFRENPKPIKGYYIQLGSIRRGSDWSGWPYISYTLVKMPERAGGKAGKAGAG